MNSDVGEIHLPESLGFPFSPLKSNGIAMTGQDSDGGGSHRENVYDACRGGVVGLSLMTWTVVKTFLNTR